MLFYYKYNDVINFSSEDDNDKCIYATVNKKKILSASSNPVKWNRIRRSHSAVFLNAGIGVGKRFSSIVQLANCWQCDVCTLVNTTVCERCFGCESPVQANREVLKLASTVDRMNIARCKNCSSRYDYTITPVEQPSHHSVINNANALLLHKYELLNYGTRKPFCNCSQPSMISLSNISTYNCVPSSNCERFLGAAVSTSPKRHTAIYESFRSKVSRSVSNDSVTIKPLLKSDMASSETWTCSNCTLVNMSSALICEACETPYRLDVNKNTKASPSVVIKVDNWDENDPTKQYLFPKPSYRRSLSEIPQSQYQSQSTNTYKTGANRRSLGDGILEAATSKAAALEYPIYAKHNALNRMCNSISSNILGSAVPNARPSTCDDSKPMYTYIGISEPSTSDRLTSGHHVYENHAMFKDAKLPKDFKPSSVYDKHAPESVYVDISYIAELFIARTTVTLDQTIFRIYRKLKSYGKCHIILSNNLVKLSNIDRTLKFPRIFNFTYKSFLRIKKL